MRKTLCGGCQNVEEIEVIGGGSLIEKWGRIEEERRKGKERNENDGEKEKLREALFEIVPPPPGAPWEDNTPILHSHRLGAAFELLGGGSWMKILPIFFIQL